MSLFSVKKRKWERAYIHCLSCGGITMSSEFYLSNEEQKNRYLHHKNFLENEGYLSFLSDFIFSVFNFLLENKKSIGLQTILSIVDYGSGPNPSMIELLSSISSVIYKKNIISDFSFNLSKIFSRLSNNFNKTIADFIPEKNNIYGWDPFFNSKSELNPESADLVLCLEVAEHFENPIESFKNMANVCSKNGIIAIGTLPINSNMVVPSDFENWWYKDDATHVSFYTEDSMKKCGSQADLEYLGMASERIFMFKKN